MKPEHFSRHEQYLLTAKLIESAHRSYLEACLLYTSDAADE